MTTHEKELLEITGAKNTKYIATRLKHVNLLVTCSRCGGCGEYSYCQMYGTTCFGCGGAGQLMPKLTDKFVSEVRSKFTPEVRAAYEADLKRRADAKAKVKAINDKLDALPLPTEYHRLNKVAEQNGVKGWMAQGDWVEQNYPHVYYTFIGHYGDADRITFITSAFDLACNKVKQVLATINEAKNIRIINKEKKPLDWAEVYAELEPLMTECERLGQIPAEDSWKPEWREYAKR